MTGNIISKALKTPQIATIHDVYWNSWAKSTGKIWTSLIGPFIEFIVVKMKYNKIITVSNASRKKIHRIFKIPFEKIEVLPNGINCSMFESLEVEKARIPTVAYLGRLVPHKNVEDLIEAARIVKKEIKEIRFKIIGSGGLFHKLRDLAKKRGVEDIVELRGFIPKYEEAIKELAASTLYVHPSTVEGFGIALLEAMAAKLPVIAYNLDAYKDFIVKGENAMLCEKRDVNGLASSIIEVLENNNLQRKLIRHGLKTSQKYDWKAIAKVLAKIYEDVSSTSVTI